MSGRWKFFVEARPWDASKRLFMILHPSSYGGRYTRMVVAPLTLVAVEPGAAIETATIGQTFEEQQDGQGDVDEFLQAALDAAWELGMRPTAYADHTNELKATRYHLEDMRALAKVPAR